MNRRWRTGTAGLFGLVAIVGIGGCSSPGGEVTCPDADKVEGVCAGVPAEDVCSSDTCADGVKCTSVIEVNSDAELSAKAKAASPGACLSLAPGQYKAVTLPGGVSLLGRSAAAVKVAGITLGAGAGAVVRGLAIGSGGVEIQGATGVRLESVRVTGDPAVKRDGVSLDAGASATIVTSTIDGAGRVGVFAKDGDVTLDRSIVSGAHAAGVWVEGTHCDAACTCTQSPTLTVKSSALRDNRELGLSLRGATASLAGADVTGTLAGDTVHVGQQGGGVVVSDCSNVVSASKLRVLNSADYGVLIDGSAATLGDEKDVNGTVEISNNLRGLWIQKGSGVSLHNGTLAGNSGVGIGVAGSSRGVVLCRSMVKGTLNQALPVFDENMVPATKAVGDGLNWLDGSEVTIEGLTLDGDARQSLLIDGPAMGNIMSITLTGGDEAKPMIQQNLMMGGAQPTLGSGVTVMSQSTRSFAVPQPLSLPLAPP